MEDKKLLNKLIKSVGKDSLIYIPSRILPALIGFIGLSLYTRLFTPVDYGYYSLVLATVGIFTIFTYLWLNNSNLRFFPVYRNRNELGKYFTTTFFLMGTSIILSMAVIFLLVEFHVISGELSNFVFVIIGLLISNSFVQTLLTILRSERKAKYVSLFTCASALCSIAISLSLIFIVHLGIISILIGQFVTDLSISFIIIFAFKFQPYIRPKYFSTAAVKEFLVYGAPFILMSISAWILAYSDRYILEYFVGAEDVGVYYAASQLGAMPIDLISSILIMAALPILINNFEENGEKSTGVLITHVIRYLLMIVTPAALGIFIISSDFASLLGNRYAVGSAIIPIISLGAILRGVYMYTDLGLQLKKKTVLMSAVMILTAVGKVFINLFFIPMFGISGAAMTTVIANFSFMAITWVISIRVLFWEFPLKSFVCSIASSIIMCLALFGVKMTVLTRATPISFALLVILGIGVYFLSITLMGELKTEIHFIRERLSSDARVLKMVKK